jgi:hypothetical protein
MVKTFLTSALIAASIAGATLVPTGAASAREGRNGAFAAGAAAGVVGGAILGSQVNRPAYGAAPVYEERDCYWRRQRVYDPDIDAYRVRRVQVCE